MNVIVILKENDEKVQGCVYLRQINWIRNSDSHKSVLQFVDDFDQLIVHAHLVGLAALYHSVFTCTTYILSLAKLYQ